jgi:hypothetical protein
MSRIIPFSRNFPTYHPKKGEPTYFVEKILNSLHISYDDYYLPLLRKLNPELPERILEDFVDSLKPVGEAEKHHTIRGGSRWKAGDKFSPRVWISRPYHPNFHNRTRIPSQLIFAPDQEVKNQWPFHIGFFSNEDVKISKCFYDRLDVNPVAYLAKNDGLQHQDFIDWFTMSPAFKKDKKFFGQIICWNADVNY